MATWMSDWLFDEVKQRTLRLVPGGLTMMLTVENKTLQSKQEALKK